MSSDLSLLTFLPLAAALVFPGPEAAATAPPYDDDVASHDTSYGGQPNRQL